jgi:hypothetical protein
MHHNDHKKIGQWMAYLWTTLVHKDNKWPIQYQPEKPFHHQHSFMAYKLPVEDSASLAMSAEIDPFPGLMMESPATIAMHLAAEKNCKMWMELDQELENMDLLARPFIYN